MVAKENKNIQLSQELVGSGMIQDLDPEHVNSGVRAAEALGGTPAPRRGTKIACPEAAEVAGPLPANIFKVIPLAWAS